MTIRERIFKRLEELKMTQKEFAEKTGISQSAISEWKAKKTNPTADKIMIICNVLDVSPEWLLSGVDKEGTRGNDMKMIVLDKASDEGELIMSYKKLNQDARARLLGYMYALNEHMNQMSKEDKKSETKKRRTAKKIKDEK